MLGRPQRIEPGPGQESVWDYPRPPRLEAVPQGIRIVFNGETIAKTHQTKRILETSHCFALRDCFDVPQRLALKILRLHPARSCIPVSQ